MNNKNKQGHLWEKQSGTCVRWTGYSGRFVCNKCLSSIKAINYSSDEPYVYSDMTDINGKKVPKNKWSICGDKKVCL